MRVAVVGLGGIGAYTVSFLHKLVLTGQLENVDIGLLDDDIVEPKNLKYQNFVPEDLTKHKAEVLGKRYMMRYKVKRVKEAKDIKEFDLIVLCADNDDVRKIVYDSDTPFIDARAEGRAVAIFTDLKATPTLVLGQSRSCQLAFELNKNIVQQGNLIAAAIVSQYVLNHVRKEENSAEYSALF